MVAVPDFGLDISVNAGSDLSGSIYRAVTMSSGVLAVASADGDALGILQDENASASGRPGKVRYTGVSRVEAGAAFSENARLKVGNSGKLIAVTAESDPSIAKALEAASADGDIVKALIHAAPGGGLPAIATFQLDLVGITGAGNVVTSFVPGFAGKILTFDAHVNVPVTTGGDAASLNLEIDGTDVTGGVIALTSANCTPIGAKIAGSAITAANEFGASDAIDIEASSVTAFAEGAVTVVIVMERA